MKAAWGPVCECSQSGRTSTHTPDRVHDHDDDGGLGDGHVGKSSHLGQCNHGQVQSRRPQLGSLQQQYSLESYQLLKYVLNL